MVIIMKNKIKPSPLVAECIDLWHTTGEETDVQGSYTGTYKKPDKKDLPMTTPYIYMNAANADDLRPIQDADDL